MELVVGFSLFFLICLLFLRLVSWIIDRYELWGIGADLLYFIFGFGAWFTLRYCLPGVPVAERMGKYWPAGFLTILVALIVHHGVRRAERGGSRS